MKHITEGNSPYKTGAPYEPANFVAGKKISDADNAMINGKINVATYEIFLAPLAVKPFSANDSLIFGSIVLVTPKQVPMKLVLIAQKLKPPTIHPTSDFKSKSSGSSKPNPLATEVLLMDNATTRYAMNIKRGTKLPITIAFRISFKSPFMYAHITGTKSW